MSGTVFEDLNGNGAHDADESGIAGVTVVLTDAAGTATSATTTADGGYVFTGVQPGAYTVTANDLTGYISTTPNTKSVSMTSGSSDTASFGDLGQGKISGSVFDDLDGNGKQDAGEGGMAGVTVKLFDDQDAKAADETVTAADGAYMFTGVDPGSYTEEETDPSGYTSITPNRVSVSIGSNGSGTASFADLIEGTISDLVFDDLDGNATRDAGEPGISGVTVARIDAQGTINETTTTTDGSYTFTGTDPGTYTLRETDADGFTSTTPNEVSVTIVSGTSAAVTFGDMSKGNISGTVFEDMNGNGVRDAGETGIAGVTLKLFNANDKIVDEDVTRVDGSYVFTGALPGSYTVEETDPDGYASITANTKSVTMASGGSAIANFADITQGTISGAVFEDLDGNGSRGASESGIAGVTIELIGADGVKKDETTTTGDGSYAFANITAGTTYTIQETDPDGYTSITPNTVSLNVGTDGSATANFADLVEGKISGVVFEDLDGNGKRGEGEPGIGGVTLELRDAGDAQVTTATTTADGAYALTNISVGQSYTVAETDPDGFTSTTTNQVVIRIESGTSATVSFGDIAKGKVAGTVFEDVNGNGSRDVGESGIAGSVLKLMDAAGETVKEITTMVDGSYSFSDTPAGAYTVEETDPEGFISTTSNTVTITIGSAGSATANFGNIAKGTISGVVFEDMNGNGERDAGERGIAEVTVGRVDADGMAQLTTTNGDGSYSFAGIEPGTYTIREENAAGFTSTTPDEVSVSISSGGSGTANFGDLVESTVTGTVFEDLNGDGTQDADERGGDSAVQFRQKDNGEDH